MSQTNHCPVIQKVHFRLTFVAQKRCCLSSLIWRLGTHFSGRCRCREVAVIERLEQQSMYGLSAETKKVAVSDGSTVL